MQQRTMLATVLLSTALLGCSASHAFGQGFHYGFDRFPRGANSLSGSSALQFLSTPGITLSPFDANRNGEIWDERALYLPVGSGAHARASTGGAPGFTDQYTAEAFFRFDAVPSGDPAVPETMRRGIMRIDRSGGLMSTLFLTRSGDAQSGDPVVLGASYRRSGPLAYATLHGTTALEIGRWYHVRMEVTRTTARILLNNVQEASLAGVVIEPITGFDTLWVGTSEGTARALEGAIDEISLRPGITGDSLLASLPNAASVLSATATVAIDADPSSGRVALHGRASDNLIHQVLVTEQNPSLFLSPEWTRVGTLQIDDAALTASWEEVVDSESLTQRFYRIETKPWIESTTRTVKGVLADRQGDFDPWNEIRWAEWYTDGRITRTFDIDTSVRFAKRATPWDVDTSALPGNPPRLFSVTANEDLSIDGNGVIIDARSPLLRTQTVADWHAGTVNLANEIGNRSAFFFQQTQPVEGDATGTRLFDLTVRGFNHAMDFNHSHRRAVTIASCDLRTNAWGVFPRGTDGTIEDCDIRENFQGGFYGEYNSTRWTFRGNRFRDNNLNGGFSYADAVLDACHGYLLEENEFLPPSVTPKNFHFAATLYRNRGEADDVREWAARYNVIRNNTIDGRRIAIEVGIRSGLINQNDRSFEARSYADNNLITGNTIRNSIIGIKINSDQNEVAHNVFESVEREIVLYAVFYKTVGNYLHHQSGSTVWLWGVPGDFAGFGDFLHYQNRQERFIPKSSKLFHVRTGLQPPTIGTPGAATLVVADTLITPGQPGSFIGNGGTPIGVAVGDFARHLPGDEFAVIHNEAISQIDLVTYHSIILYDNTGLEIDRCGRSTRPWSLIAAANMLPDTGFIPENLNDELVAASSQVNDTGHRPLSVFRKGWRDAAVELEQGNTSPWLSLAVGDFLPGGDGYSEIVAVRSSGADAISVVYVKPTNPAWRQEIILSATNVRGIVAGEFDGNTTNGDEIALLAEFAPGLHSVRFFRRGEATPFAEIEPETGSPAWTSIASGRFDPSRPHLNGVALSVSNSGVFAIHYPDDDNAWAERTIPDHSKALRAIASGRPHFNATGDLIDTFTADATADEAAATWGDWLAVLPIRQSNQRVPLVWLNSDSLDDTRTHTRVVPILR